MAVKIEKGGWIMIFLVGLVLVGYSLVRYGVIDSSKEPYDDAERTPLGDAVAEKLVSQGIKAPWQR